MPSRQNTVCLSVGVSGFPGQRGGMKAKQEQGSLVEKTQCRRKEMDSERNLPQVNLLNPELS